MKFLINNKYQICLFQVSMHFIAATVLKSETCFIYEVN